MMRSVNENDHPISCGCSDCKELNKKRKEKRKNEKQETTRKES